MAATADKSLDVPGAVLLYSHSWVPGQVDGVAVRMMAHANELAGRGVKVTVVTPDFVIDGQAPAQSPLTASKPAGMEHELVTTKRTPVYRKNLCMEFSFGNLWKLYGIIQRTRPEVVHATQEASIFVVVVACVLHDVPLVVSMHTDVGQIAARDQGFSFLGGGAIGRLHTVVAVSIVKFGYRVWSYGGAIFFCVSKQAQSFLADAGVAKRRVIEHTWGPMVDRGTFRIDLPEEEVAATREDLTFGIPNAFLMTYVGRVTAEKDIQFLLDAMARVPDNVVFAIIGTGSMAPEIKKMHGRKHRIHCTGEIRSRAQVALALRASDCCVSASTMETVGFTAMESLSCGTPMLAARAQGFAEHLSHGINARLWTPLDGASFDDELAEMMKGWRAGAWCREDLRKTMDSAALETCTDRALQAYRLAPHPRRHMLSMPLAIFLFIVNWLLVCFVR